MDVGSSLRTFARAVARKISRHHAGEGYSGTAFDRVEREQVQHKLDEFLAQAPEIERRLRMIADFRRGRGL